MPQYHGTVGVLADTSPGGDVRVPIIDVAGLQVFFDQFDVTTGSVPPNDATPPIKCEVGYPGGPRVNPTRPDGSDVGSTAYFAYASLPSYGWTFPTFCLHEANTVYPNMQAIELGFSCSSYDATTGPNYAPGISSDGSFELRVNGVVIFNVTGLRLVTTWASVQISGIGHLNGVYVKQIRQFSSIYATSPKTQYTTPSTALEPAGPDVLRTENFTDYTYGQVFTTGVGIWTDVKGWGPAYATPPVMGDRMVFGPTGNFQGVILGHAFSPAVPAGSGSGVPNPSVPLSVAPSRLCTQMPPVSSPARNAGCNTGGMGFVPDYLGPSGAMPIGADPLDGERLTGKRAINLWAEVTHANY